MADEQAVRGVYVESSNREREARKWLLGLVLAGVAAAITSYVTGGITAGVDRVRGSFEEEPAPLGVTVTHSPKEAPGTGCSPSRSRPSRHFLFPTGDLGALDSLGCLGARPRWAWTARRQQSRSLSKARLHSRSSSQGSPAEVVERAPPPRGVHVVPFSGGTCRRVTSSVDLDESPPVVASVAAPAEFESRDRRVDFPYRVSATDPEVFLIVAGPEVRLHVAREPRVGVSGEEGHDRHRRRGQPFRTVSPSEVGRLLPEVRPRLEPANALGATRRA